MSQLFKSKASTLRKVAELPKYRHPADLLNIPVRDIRQQRAEIQGKLQYNANNYSSLAHENLLKSIIPNRHKYRSEKIQTRLNIATQQYNSWSQYLNTLVSQLQENEKVDGLKKQKIYESYLIAKQRNQERLQMSKMVRMFYELQNGFQFDIPIDPIIMMRMTHPHFGYLNNYTTTRLPFEQICKYLEQMIAVSKIMSKGHTLHADELLSFTFWKLNSSKPTLKLAQFTTLLKKFKFETSQNYLEGVNSILEYHLKNRQGEIRQQQLIRFDLWRNFYLQRGL